MVTSRPWSRSGPHLHQLLQGLVAGAQLGHGEGGGDADGGHEDVVLGGPAEGHLFVERQREAAVGLGQLPDAGVGGLGDGLRGGRLRAVGVGAAVDAARLQGQVPGLGAADVQHISRRQGQGRQDQQPPGGLRSGQRRRIQEPRLSHNGTSDPQEASPHPAADLKHLWELAGEPDQAQLT